MTQNPQNLEAVFAEGRVASYRRLLQAMLDAGLNPVGGAAGSMALARFMLETQYRLDE